MDSHRYVKPAPLGKIVVLKDLPWIPDTFVIRIAGEMEGSLRKTAERLAFLSENRTGFPKYDIAGWEKLLREWGSQEDYAGVFTSA